MTPKTAISVFSRLMSSGRPVFLWGAPGLGKSAIIKQAARECGRTVHDVRAVLLDPVDLRGIPTIVDGRTRWAPPEFLPSEPNSVLFLDELPQAAPLVQSACLSLLLDRSIGEYRLPDGCVVVAAGNRSEDRAGAHRVLSPILNRAIHIDVEASVDDWMEWALVAGIDATVRSFIAYRPALLSQNIPADGSKAWATPRSWHCVSDAIAHVGTDIEVVSGIVGKSAASEFCTFAAIHSTLPDLDLILKSPDKASVPTSPSVLYALCGALVEKIRTANGDQLESFVKYVRRMPREFQTLAMRDAFSVRLADMRACTAAREWALANASVLIAKK